MKKQKEKKLVRKPSFFVWYILGPLVILYFRLQFRFRRNKVKIRKKSLVLAPHRAYADFLTIPISIYPYRPHFVATSYWFRNKSLGKLLRFLGCIKKDQYRADVNAIKEMSDCFKRDEIVMMFPEGQMAPDGKSQLIVKGVERLIKKYKVNVYFVNPKGSYLTGPKWHGKVIRGDIDAETSLIIKEEDIDNLSTDEIMNIIEKEFEKNDDLEWIKSKPEYKYTNRQKARGLEKACHVCPKCHKEFTLVSDKSRLYCTECDFSVEFEKTSFNFKENPYFKSLDELLKFENDQIRKDIKENTEYVDEARVISYETVEGKETKFNKVKMTNEKVSLVSDDETVDFDISKIINFIITMGVSFEIPTPESTYRVYLKNGNASIKYWSRMRYIKEEK